MIKQLSMVNLQEARAMCLEMADIQKRIAASYDTRRSPSINPWRISQGQLIDPTSSSFLSREGMIEKYWNMATRLLEYQRFVSESIPDPVIRAAVISHYFCGVPWNKTGFKGNPKIIEQYISQISQVADPVTPEA